MDLVSQRLDFTRCLTQLLNYAKLRSIPVAVDQVKRTQQECDTNAAAGIGISHSLHLEGLAVDLLVFRKTEPTTTGAVGWVYLNHGTEKEYSDLGEFWLSLHPLARWGGKFTKPDYGHFSLTRNGVE